MKSVTIGDSDPISIVKMQLENNHHITTTFSLEYFSFPLITIKDLYEIQNADVVLLFGTWGSNTKERKWHIKNNLDRAAWLENIIQFFVHICKSYDKKLIVFETGTLCRVRSAISRNTYWKEESPRYYRMGLNHWTYEKAKFCKPAIDRDRIKIFIKENAKYEKILTEQMYNHQWKNNKNGVIVICPSLENDPTISKPVEKFVDDTINEIKKYTNRKIIIKPHPKTEIDFSKYNTFYNNMKPGWDKKTFRDYVDQIYCVVLDNSTSIFELIFLGIPCFTSKGNFGHKLKNNDLSKVENIYYNTPEEMKEWYNEMAHTNFSISEIGSKKILSYINELINE